MTDKKKSEAIGGIDALVKAIASISNVELDFDNIKPEVFDLKEQRKKEAYLASVEIATERTLKRRQYVDEMHSQGRTRLMLRQLWQLRVFVHPWKYLMLRFCICSQEVLVLVKQL